MNSLLQICRSTVQSRRAQILLPAVMLAPIFILVIYLLFETSKLSMTKVRNQFALDNAAYSQMSTASAYLNAVAMVNGNLPYRVMRTMADEPPLRRKSTATMNEDLTLFDVFYRAGAFPAIGPDYVRAYENPKPGAESNDWKFKYYQDKRKNWLKDDPSDAEDDREERDDGKYYVMTDKDIADNYFFGFTGVGLRTIKEYLTVFVRTGSIYASQNYVYKDTIKKSRMFRESYYLNTRDCRKSECAQQAAATLDRFELNTLPFEIDKGLFYVTADFQGSTQHSGAYPIPLDFEKIIKTKLFQFAYLDGSSRSKLKKLARGITLKQKYTLPANRFNINVTQRYKPYVRNTVSITCPRSGNNCVWPNPIPKYSVKVGV